MEERNIYLTEKLLLSQSFSLCMLMFSLSKVDTGINLQWRLLGEVGTTEIEEQIQQDSTNLTRSFLHSRHFMETERRQISAMLVQRSRAAHDVAERKLNKLVSEAKRLKEKRLSMEQRICNMNSSLDIFIRQNSYTFNEIFDRQESKLKILFNCVNDKVRLLDDYQKKIEIVAQIIIYVLEEKDSAWKKIDIHVERKEMLKVDRKCKIITPTWENVHQTKLYSNAVENEHYQDKLKTVSEQLCLQEIAIQKMTLHIKQHTSFATKDCKKNDSSSVTFPPIADLK